MSFELKEEGILKEEYDFLVVDGRLVRTNLKEEDKGKEILSMKSLTELIRKGGYSCGVLIGDREYSLTPVEVNARREY